MESFTIEIIGAGLVGTATGAAFAGWGHEVVYKELLPDRREQLQASGDRVVAPDTPVEAALSCISVPTPFDADRNTLDMTHVEAAVELLAETTPNKHDHVVAIRSTVLPGTTERLADTYEFEHIAMVPEFLSAATAVEEARNITQLVIGTHSDRAHDRIEAAFAAPDPAVIQLSPTEAELVKLASNAYAATKISFANQLWRIGDSIDDTHRDRVLEAFRSISPWVGTTRGLAGGWPYGGACLPKDTNGLHAWLQAHDMTAPQLDGTITENELMRARDRDQRSYGSR